MAGVARDGRGVVFIVNGREMSWTAATCAYGDAAIDNRDLALIAACR